MASGRRWLVIAGLVSVAAHLLVILVLLLLPHGRPHEASPAEQGTVELLMVEKKGSVPSNAVAKRPDQPAPQPEQQDASVAQAAPSAPASKAPPLPADKGEEPVPPAAVQPAPEQTKAADAAKPVEAAKPAQPADQQGPVFDLSGTESESNAYVLGNHILPAAPDNRFRNRPPPYPAEAAMNGEHGSVVVVIHVSANGLAAGVDILESSGIRSLDDAVLEAVRRWHFRPAIRDGQPVPFDMPFRFVFEDG